MFECLESNLTQWGSSLMCLATMPGRRASPYLCKGEINDNTFFLLSQTSQLLKTGYSRETNDNWLTTNNKFSLLKSGPTFPTAIFGTWLYTCSWTDNSLQNHAEENLTWQFTDSWLDTYQLLHLSVMSVVHLSKKWMNIMSRQGIKSEMS